MSRTKKDHHDSWRAWGEYRKERSRLKDFDNWKTEALQDMEPEVSSVFVIINQWSPVGSDLDLTEIVGNVHYGSEDAAWEDLAIIASESFGIEIDVNDLEFDAPEAHLRKSDFEYDTYYIQELKPRG